MKNQFLILTLMLLTTLSCEKDESELSIVGTWKLASVTAAEAIDMNEDNLYNTDVLKEIEGCFEQKYTFNADGSLGVVVESSPIVYKDGNYITDVTKCESERANGSWKIDETNSRLSITADGENETLDIVLKEGSFNMPKGFRYSVGAKTVFGNVEFKRI